MLPLPAISREEALLQHGSDIECAWCQRANTKSKPRWAEWSDWVHIPFADKSQCFVCHGCASEVYHACADDDYEASPDRSLVKAIAAQMHVSEQEFRCACLRHWIATVAELKVLRPNQRRWVDRVEAIVRALQGGVPRQSN